MADESLENEKSAQEDAAAAQANLYRPINGPVFKEWMVIEPICAAFLGALLRRTIY